MSKKLFFGRGVDNSIGYISLCLYLHHRSNPKLFSTVHDSLDVADIFPVTNRRWDPLLDAKKLIFENYFIIINKVQACIAVYIFGRGKHIPRQMDVRSTLD